MCRSFLILSFLCHCWVSAWFRKFRGHTSFPTIPRLLSPLDLFPSSPFSLPYPVPLHNFPPPTNFSLPRHLLIAAFPTNSRPFFILEHSLTNPEFSLASRPYSSFFSLSSGLKTPRTREIAIKMAMNKSASPAEGQHAHVSDGMFIFPCGSDQVLNAALPSHIHCSSTPKAVFTNSPPWAS